MTSHKVRIAARLRPRLRGETEADDGSLVVNQGSIDIGNPRDKTQTFSFPLTSCYGPQASQEQIFETDVLPLLDFVFSGVTNTVLCYGVTSSGKTHTMQGTPSDPGVIPRTVRAIFARPPSHRYVSMTVSYMEIYKDDVYDLLVDRENAPKLPVRENGEGKVFVANLSREPIENEADFHRIYTRATKQRSVGSTNLNNQSSRSHAVLTIEVTMSDDGDTSLLGKINLVDLAGSENNKITGNSDPGRMAESAAINKSLSVLGQVVHALNQNASRIPYRNSKLTRILQDALGGQSVGLLICNLAPAMKFRQDTLNTLNFAVHTKSIENKPVVNERDNRPQPKPHFAAIQPPAPRLAPAMVQPISTAGSSRLSLPPSGRPAASGSRVPRISGFGAYQGSSAASTKRGGLAGVSEVDRPRSSIGGNGMGMTDEALDARIAKAVEAEVARRMAERERMDVEARKAEEARMEAGPSRHRSPSPKQEQIEEQSLPPDVLHKDTGLQDRLEELERKFEQGNKELQLADVLSPGSKKKTGRAYVALARSHSEKGDLQVALDLYRKAEAYVPDNQKLKERIMEIDYRIKHGTEHAPSPRKPKQRKKKKQGVTSRKSSATAPVPVDDEGDVSRIDVDELPAGNAQIKDEPMVEDFVSTTTRTTRGGSRKGKGKGSQPTSAMAGEFGAEVTNSPVKRSLELEEGVEEVAVEDSPPKRLRRNAGRKARVEAVVVSDDDDEWVPEPPQPVKRSRRKQGIAPE